MSTDDERREQLEAKIRADLAASVQAPPDRLPVPVEYDPEFDGGLVATHSQTELRASYGLFQTLPAPIPYGRREPALPDDLPDDPAERIMAIFMLRAARFAPRGGVIRFSAIERDETGDHVVRQASVPTEDARRLTGLPYRRATCPDCGVPLSDPPYPEQNARVCHECDWDEADEPGPE